MSTVERPNRFSLRTADIAFAAAIIVCLVLAAEAIRSGLSVRAAAPRCEGGRQVNVEVIRDQVSTGALSTKKALFYRKNP
jgi:hypothetical protein